MTAPAAARRGPFAWLERNARALTVANVVAQAGIIVSGGLVRLTGSGLGCSSWPECEPGSFTPVASEATGYHPFIEFGNRTLTFVLTIIAVALAIAVWRTRRDLRWWGLVPLAGVVAQAVLGGITVLVDLDPRVVGPHMLLSVLLVWVSTWLALRYRDAPRRPSGAPSLDALRWASLLLFAGVVGLGVLTTGAGPHSGDAEATARLALDPVEIAKAHAWTVWAFAAVVATIALILFRRRTVAGEGAALRAAEWLVAATLAQGAIGYIQYFAGLPPTIVALHLVGIGALTVAHSATFVLTRRA